MITKTTENFIFCKISRSSDAIEWKPTSPVLTFDRKIPHTAKCLSLFLIRTSDMLKATILVKYLFKRFLCRLSRLSQGGMKTEQKWFHHYLPSETSSDNHILMTESSQQRVHGVLCSCCCASLWIVESCNVAEILRECSKAKVGISCCPVMQLADTNYILTKQVHWASFVPFENSCLLEINKG